MERTTSPFAWKFIAATMAFGAAQASYAQQAAETRTPILKQALPPGDFRNVQAVIVELAPSSSAPRHRHDVAAFAYVLQGSLENQFDGGALLMHKQGDSFWEAPGTVHNIARNPSATERTRLLIVYIGEEGKAPSVPLD